MFDDYTGTQPKPLRSCNSFAVADRVGEIQSVSSREDGNFRGILASCPPPQLLPPLPLQYFETKQALGRWASIWPAVRAHLSSLARDRSKHKHSRLGHDRHRPRVREREVMLSSVGQPERRDIHTVSKSQRGPYLARLSSSELELALTPPPSAACFDFRRVRPL